jgi:hypothetical protein
MISGVASLVRCALYLDVQLDIEIMSIGRGGLERENTCTLEACGRHLSYRIVLDNTYVFLYVQVLDSIDAPEFIMSVGDCNAGWHNLCRLVRAFERNGIRSLQPRAA